MTEDLHMVMTPVYPPQPGDSARAAALVAEVRRSLSKYRDVKLAEADGYRVFAPGVRQAVYHYTNRANAMAARRGLDPDRPTSLLYRRTDVGGWELIGVMYTAPRTATLAELNERIPLSVARWHEHVNWCLPPGGRSSARWRERQNGQPVFGPRAPIATAEACTAVGGRFVPHLFGWMVHVQAFEGDDPAQIWAHKG